MVTLTVNMAVNTVMGERSAVAVQENLVKEGAKWRRFVTVSVRVCCVVETGMALLWCFELSYLYTVSTVLFLNTILTTYD